MPLVTAMRLKEQRGKSQVPEAIQYDEEKSKASPEWTNYWYLFTKWYSSSGSYEFNHFPGPEKGFPLQPDTRLCVTGNQWPRDAGVCVCVYTHVCEYLCRASSRHQALCNRVLVAPWCWCVWIFMQSILQALSLAIKRDFPSLPQAQAGGSHLPAG